jgi:hypothetical protein
MNSLRFGPGLRQPSDSELVGQAGSTDIELYEGQRVEFEWRGARAANDRKHASNVRPI